MSKPAGKTLPFRSFADAAEPQKPEWVQVMVPKPRYESNAEKQRWEQAAEENPIREGESRAAWSERVAAAALQMGDRELPAGDRAERIPGEEG